MYDATAQLLDGQPFDFVALASHLNCLVGVCVRFCAYPAAVMFSLAQHVNETEASSQLK